MPLQDKWLPSQINFVSLLHALCCRWGVCPLAWARCWEPDLCKDPVLPPALRPAAGSSACLLSGLYPVPASGYSSLQLLLKSFSPIEMLSVLPYVACRTFSPLFTIMHVLFFQEDFILVVKWILHPF